MSEKISLVTKSRDKVGTGAARELRRNGLMPATIYGFGRDAISVALETKEITKYYRKPQYITQVFEMEVDGVKYKVLPKSIDLDPVTDIPQHADFLFVSDGLQKMSVPIVYKNKEVCLGVKRGGYFNTVRRSLKLLCSASDLPRKLELDVTNMRIGRSIKAKEIPLPEGSTLLENGEMVVASIIGKKGKDDSADGEAA